MRIVVTVMGDCFYCVKMNELKSLRAENDRLKSGREIANLSSALEKEKRKNATLQERNRKLHQEINDLKTETFHIRCDYYADSHEIEDLKEENRRLRTRIAHYDESFNDELIDRVDKLVIDLYDEVCELQGKILKMTAQLNRDFTTSSKPSSQCPNRAPIQNNREKTRNKPGGKVGHGGHKRKDLPATELEILPFPDEVLKSPLDYEYVDFKSRKLTDIKMSVIVTEVRSAVFRNIYTGKEVYTDYPKGMGNEINYGAGLKAFCCLTNNYLNVPLRKTAAFVKDLTHGEIEIVPSTIFNLSHEFAKRTKKDRSEIFRNLLTSPYMHSDATTIRIEGKLYQVFVSTNGKDVLYQFRKHKGDDGIKGTPVENYMFVLIHDHDVTYFKYGGDHQKCISHETRYVKDSMVNEEELEWNKLMHEHLQWIVHNFKEGNLSDTESIKEAKDRYYEILDLAMEEYEKMSATRLKYYKEGYNTAKRLKDYGENLLYFLTHPEIPYTNNEAERRARRIKGKLRVIGTFRSFSNAIDYLKFMSYTETSRDIVDNKFERLVEVFS